MNIYARYFDHENVFNSAQAIISFLVNLNDFKMTSQLENEITSYFSSNMPYPKRVKVRNNVYFILIKTNATNLAEFKSNRKNPEAPQQSESNRKDEISEQLRAERIGWYKVSVDFKRMLVVPATQKCQYRDTHFSAYVYATSASDSYKQVIEHLRNRQDIDPRSQFPSEKRNAFSYTYLGDNIPEAV